MSKSKLLIYFRTIVLIFCSILSFGACQSQSIAHIKPITGYEESISKSTNYDHGADFNSYKTFSIVEPKESIAENQLTGLSAQPIRLIIAEAMEFLGYKWVDKNQNPDMLITIAGRTESTTARVSGGTGYFPIMIPGQSQTFFGSVGGTPIYGQTSSSGSMQMVPFQKPDYVAQDVWASLSVGAFDSKNLKELVSSRASGRVVSPDPSIGTQFLIGSLMQSFPQNKKGQEAFNDSKKWKGRIGFFSGLRTIGGSDLYSVILSVVSGSPAESAGLRNGDVLTEINGNSIKNIRGTTWMNNTSVQPRDKVVFTVWRGGQDTIKITTIAEEYK